jgi:hypothetical protein
MINENSKMKAGNLIINEEMDEKYIECSEDEFELQEYYSSILCLKWLFENVILKDKNPNKGHYIKQKMQKGFNIDEKSIRKSYKMWRERLHNEQEKTNGQYKMPDVDQPKLINDKQNIVISDDLLKNKNGINVIQLIFPNVNTDVNISLNTNHPPRTENKLLLPPLIFPKYE